MTDSGHTPDRNPHPAVSSRLAKASRSSGDWKDDVFVDGVVVGPIMKAAAVPVLT
jgi:hypothetical protein